MSCCRGSKVKNDRFSTFSDACFTANIDKMKEQLKKNSKNKLKIINEPNPIDGMSPIHRAAQHGNPEVVKFLIEQKADVNALSSAGETPLHVACFHKKRQAVEKLLQTKAKDLINKQTTSHGMTALHVAIYRGSPEIAELLLKAGADPSISDKYGHNAMQLAEFWVGQADAGLCSPTANHYQTLNILKSRQSVKIAHDPSITRSNKRHEIAV